jgi:hypothetical protein
LSCTGRFLLKESYQTHDKPRWTIFFTFAIADDDLLAGEINIIDAESAAFEDAEAGAVEEFGLKKFNSI